MQLCFLEICNSLSLVPRSHPAFRRCSTEKQFGIHVWGEPGNEATILSHSFIFVFLQRARGEEGKAQEGEWDALFQHGRGG